MKSVSRRRRSLFRVPSLKKRITARTSVKRAVRQRLGLKAPRGWGWLTDTRRAAYNRVYNRTSIGCAVAIVSVGLVTATAAVVLHQLPWSGGRVPAIHAILDSVVSGGAAPPSDNDVAHG